MRMAFGIVFSVCHRDLFSHFSRFLSRKKLNQDLQDEQDMSRIFKIHKISKMMSHLQRQCSCKCDSVPNACRSQEAVSLNGDYNLGNPGNRVNPASD